MVKSRNNNSVILIVDLDKTLIKVNTIYDFLEKFFPRKFLLISRILFPLIFFNRLIGTDIYKRMLVACCFKGINEHRIRRYAYEYFNHVTQNSDQYFEKLVLEVLLNKKDNIRKVLLTASLDIIAEHFKELGFDLIISSKTFYKNGKYSGMLDLFMNKHRIIKVFSKYFNRIVIIEDSPEPEYYKIKNAEIRVIKVDSRAFRR